MDREQRRLYNKKYRELNCVRIESHLGEQKACHNCGKTVRHQNMRAHKRTKHCKNNPLIKLDTIIDTIHKSEVNDYVEKYKADLLSTFNQLMISKRNIE